MNHPFIVWIPGAVILPKKEYETYLISFGMHPKTTDPFLAQEDLMYLDRVLLTLSRGGTTE